MFDEANKWLKEGLQIYQNRPELYKAHTRIMCSEGKLKQAINMLQKLKNSFSEDNEIDQQMGKLYYMDNQKRQALSIYIRLYNRSKDNYEKKAI